MKFNYLSCFYHAMVLPASKKNILSSIPYFIRKISHMCDLPKFICTNTSDIDYNCFMIIYRLWKIESYSFVLNDTAFPSYYALCV